MLIGIESENYKIYKDEPKSVTYKLENKYIPNNYIEIDIVDIDEVRELLSRAEEILEEE